LLTETTTSTADQPAHSDTDPVTAEAAPAPAAAIDAAPETTAPDVPAPVTELAAATPEAPLEAEAALPVPAVELSAEAVAADAPAEPTEPPPALDMSEPSDAAEILPGAIVIDADVPVRAVFADLGLSEPILRAIAEMGYLHPTPIQEQAIPIVLMGRDVMGVAQTGTGKTAGFTLPMLDILAGSRARARMPRSLILEPTRELALQVAENFVQYGKHLKLTHALLIGGESMNDQKDALMRGVDVLIATPGRLIDLFERGGLLMTDTKILVIDEADRMLDMGFIPDVERIVAMLPKNRQTLFFSATMAPEIKRLSDAFLQNPKIITVSRAASVAPTIVAGLVMVEELDKREALRRLIKSEDVQQALIFCNRKIEVDALTKSLKKHEFSVGALHGDLSQPERTATLAKFKANEIRLLVCSDVAARGIDIGGLGHVFNFDVPHHAEDYVHRIGRTGRAGMIGHAFTLATPDDRLSVEAIEKLVNATIPRITIEGLETAEWAAGDGKKRRGRGGKSAAPKEVKAKAEPKPRSRKPAIAKEAPIEDLIPALIPEPRRARPPRPEPVRDTPRPEPVRHAEKLPPAPAPAFRDRPRREGRYREDDLGPAVQGFGDDVPAFMMIRLRTRAEAPRQSEDVDA
jgi:superfamily II DNA/RNA helicase